jgi:hypothetical protein
VNNLTGEVRQYQADDTGELTNIGGDIKGTVSFTSGRLSATVEVSTPTVPLKFSETFTTSNKQPLPRLRGSVYVAEKTATDNTVRSLLLLDPSSAGLSYSTLGAWGYEPSGSPTTSYGGWFAVGIETRAADIPTTGTANYLGGMAGTYANGTTIYGVAAVASATANFGARSIKLTTNDTTRFDLNPLGSNGISDPSLNIIDSTLTYSAGVNRITGDVKSSTMSGTAAARFFGPAAAELGGAFSMNNGTNTEQMTGSFVLKKQ